jgi:D-xylose transport system substrate-binding protein
MTNRATILATVALVGALGATAAQAQSGGHKIGVLFPDNQTPSWEMRHWPSIRDTVMADCADCEVIYGNVAGDPVAQRDIADSMFAQGIDVLVLAPVNASTAGVIIRDAESRGIPVVAYGSIPEGPVTAFVGLDIIELGRIEGQALLDAMKERGDPMAGCVVALNGDAQNAAVDEFLKGRAETLDPYVDICKEYWVPNWSSANAQDAMDQAITALGKDKIIGVYAMNDGIAAGAAAAMKSAGFEIPLIPLGGMDADVAAIQRLLVGEQTYDVDQRAAIWGEAAAPVALALARGEELVSDKTETNGEYTFPWFDTPPMVVVTKDNVKELLIDPGYRTLDEICTPTFVEACKANGLM